MAKKENSEVANQAIKSIEKASIILGFSWIARQVLKDQAEIQAKAQAEAFAKTQTELEAKAEAEAKAQAEAEANAKAEAEAAKPHWLERVSFRILQVGYAIGTAWMVILYIDDELFDKFIVPLVMLLNAITLYLFSKKD